MIQYLYPAKKKPIKVTTALKKKIDPLDWRTVYHIKEWKDSFGFCTAIELDNNKIRYCNYITKYITKDVKKIFGKYYWSSKNILRDTDNSYSNISRSELMSNKLFKGKIITPRGLKLASDMQMTSKYMSKKILSTLLIIILYFA